MRGQYGPGKKIDGTPCPGYRAERDVNPQSNTETFAALRLFIDNWRWDGVPIYLRSGQGALEARHRDHRAVQEGAGGALRGTAAAKLSSNRLIFHIQPDQAIESLFQAKTPGPTMRLQPVNMRFSYGDAFRASRGTGYEVMIYSCMCGDPDAVLTHGPGGDGLAHRAAVSGHVGQSPADFPNYAAGTWGPRAANDLIEQDGRRWFEVINRETLERVPLFKGGDPVFLNQVCMALQPRAAKPGETIIRKGEPGLEMYMISRGECEVLDSSGEAKVIMREGDAFGEIALLLAEPRTATVRAKTMCDLFVLEKADFNRILHEQPKFAQAIKEIALERYQREI